MPVLVVAVVFFAIFLAMGVLATLAVLMETRALPGSVLLRLRRARPIPSAKP